MPKLKSIEINPSPKEHNKKLQSNSLSDSGKELVIDELVDVTVLRDWLFGCFPY